MKTVVITNLRKIHEREKERGRRKFRVSFALPISPRTSPRSMIKYSAYRYISTYMRVIMRSSIDAVDLALKALSNSCLPISPIPCRVLHERQNSSARI